MSPRHLQGATPPVPAPLLRGPATVVVQPMRPAVPGAAAWPRSGSPTPSVPPPNPPLTPLQESRSFMPSQQPAPLWVAAAQAPPVALCLEGAQVLMPGVPSTALSAEAAQALSEDYEEKLARIRSTSSHCIDEMHALLRTLNGETAEQKAVELEEVGEEPEEDTSESEDDACGTWAQLVRKARTRRDV